MGKRADLNQILLDVLGNTHVYFQPPESVSLEYPCIVYKRDKMTAAYANDKAYKDSTRYQVTVIDKDPDSQVAQSIFGLPLCSHLRNFAHSGLNHDIFELYY